ncbi:aldo/keto reductase [Saccharothrix australiensis]|uniref:Aryl-alcohol dehydrogenase-like predicted oxidoreductase n=1 Tax=Saccharothrix australiensis TaxID=2072 RepID=A0A495W2B6_9PSEU|nr:aldo/keto reductase [Saccharothrix australiensis]RKT55534.1 aryl-alcohol dehydrogenase-like predicted oxidoreductase [Saccharothrix australiensis]
MESRQLGTGGPVVAAVGLGCLGLSGGYGAVAGHEAATAIRTALDLGITLLDTADFYGGGENERLVGRAIAGRRDEVVLATRGGVRAAAPGAPPTIVDGAPDSLRAACEASLERLGVDHVDLYYLARADPRVPVEDSVGALAELRAEGKVRHVGLSEVAAGTLRRAAATCTIAALESEYSLWERHVEAEILPTARELGIGLVAHTPLGKGFLTGAHRSPGDLGERDHRRNHPRFREGNFERNRELVEEAAAIAARTGMTPAQLALAWLLSAGPDVVPIPGSRRPEHLRENVRAAALRLDAADRARLAEVFAPERVAGERHPAHRRVAGVAEDGRPAG